MDPEQLTIMTQCAPWALAALGLGAALLYREQAEKNKIFDHETHLFTKHGFLIFLADSINQTSRRNNGDLCLLYIDFDRMREYNDKYGHPAVDLMIRQISCELNRERRRNDVFGRIGGDEFAGILRQTNEEQALKAAVRLQLQFAERFPRGFILPNGVAVSEGIAFTIGIAKYKVGMNTTAFATAADDQLRTAKRMGHRNCIIMNDKIYSTDGKYRTDLKI